MKVVFTKDPLLVDLIRKKLSENGGYCPCRIDKTTDTKCMCKEFRDQIERGEPGLCHCGLYTAVKEEGGENNK